jgi:hypothetical protein
MKIKSTLILIALSLYVGANWAVAFDTAITYQGQLLNSGSPANGTYNMIFKLFNNSTGAGTPAATVPVNSVLVSDGLFTVPIPFDPSLFTAGAAYWLQIQVEPSGGSFSTLSPVQPLTTVPYALFTETSGALSGTLPATQLSGTILPAQLPATVLTENESGTLANLTLNGALDLPATQVSPDIIYSGPGFLLYADNNGNFFSGQQAGASTTNTSSGMNNTGGGVSALANNTGGSGNTAYGFNSLFNNTNGSYNTAIGTVALRSNFSGSNNIALGNQSGLNITTGSANIDIGNPGAINDNNVIRIGTQGTETNTFVAGIYNVPISGGLPVVVNSSGQLGSSSIIQGQSLQIGLNNTATGAYATITGGTNNTVNGNEAAVLGGYLNVASGPASSVTGGSANTASGDHAIVSGGRGNTASGPYSCAMGGTNDIASGFASAAVSGAGNSAGGLFSFVGSGWGNSASSDEDVVVGGISNSVAGDPAFIGAGQYNTVGTFSGTGKSGIAVNSFIVAGIDNAVYSDNSGIGGGGTNYIGTNANSSFIGGGNHNTILSGATGVTISGGVGNLVQALVVESSIGGGQGNTINSGYSVIGGGLANIIGTGANNASLGGGSNNLVSGVEGTVPGGGNNVAGGIASFAAGEGSRAVNNGTFVWSDGSSAAFTSTANDQFLIQASGGVGIGTNGPTAPLHVVGTRKGNSSQPIAFIENLDATTSSASALRVIAHGAPSDGALSVSTAWPNGTGTTNVLIARFGNANSYVSQLDNNGNWTATTFNSSSDRNAKENFQPVSAREMLDRVSAMPISRWNYKADKGSEHIGPMAQDFWAAFKVGMDDKHIATVDEDGVALAAIQGLNQKLGETQQSVKDKDVEIQTLMQQNDSLAARLSELEATVKQLATQK